MKNLLYLCLAVSLFTVSCDSDDLEDLTDQEVGISLDENFTVDVNEGEDLTFSTTESFSLTDDSAIDVDDLENVESFNIEKLSFIIPESDIDANEDDITFSGSIVISSNSVNLTLNLPSIALGTIKGVEQDVTSSLDQAALNTLSQALIDGEEVDLTFFGTLSDSPVNFEMTVTVAGTVTINVI